MEPLSFRRRHFLSVLASLGYGASSSISLAAGDPIAVVIAAGSRQKNLSADKLRRIFLALPTDNEDGQRFVPINLAQGINARERFDRSVLNMSPAEAARYWIDQRLRGSKPPRSANSLDVCRRAVQEIPGAISYLPLSAVGNLRVLSVDGRLPQDSTYSLK